MLSFVSAPDSASCDRGLFGMIFSESALSTAHASAHCSIR